MTADETIRARRSIRKYQPQELSADLMEEILDLARHAPSAMNGQPWQFVVIRDSDLKSKLAEIKVSRCPADKKAYAADYLATAPVVVAICVDRSRSFERERENGILAAAVLILAATSRGLGSVFLTAYRKDDPELEREVTDALELSSEFVPVALVPLGYPAETPPPKEMRPLEEMTRYA